MFHRNPGIETTNNLHISINHGEFGKYQKFDKNLLQTHENLGHPYSLCRYAPLTVAKRMSKRVCS